MKDKAHQIQSCVYYGFHYLYSKYKKNLVDLNSFFNFIKNCKCFVDLETLVMWRFESSLSTLVIDV